MLECALSQPSRACLQLSTDVLQGEPPFNVIHVGAAADELHQQLVDALAPGGRMVIPLGPRYGSQVRCVP